MNRFDWGSRNAGRPFKIGCTTCPSSRSREWRCFSRFCAGLLKPIPRKLLKSLWSRNPQIHLSPFPDWSTWSEPRIGCSKRQPICSLTERKGYESSRTELLRAKAKPRRSMRRQGRHSRPKRSPGEDPRSNEVLPSLLCSSSHLAGLSRPSLRKSHQLEPRKLQNLRAKWLLHSISKRLPLKNSPNLSKNRLIHQKLWRRSNQHLKKKVLLKHWVFFYVFFVLKAHRKQIVINNILKSYNSEEKILLPPFQKKYPVDFDDELKIGDVRYDDMTKITIKVQLFWRLPYEIKLCSKMNCFWVIGDSKKVLFLKKSPFLFFY